MRRSDRRPRRFAMAASLALVTVAAQVTSSAAIAAEPLQTTSDAARKVGDPVPGDRGRVDVGRLSRAPETRASRVPSIPTTIDPPAVPPPDVSVNAGPAPVQATTTAAPSAIKPGWAGFNQSQTGFALADPGVAVGPDHVLQVVNTSLQIWDRTHVVKKAPTLVSVPQLFNLPDDLANLHPTFIYDALHGRWVGTEVSWTCDYDQNGTADDPVGYVDFAISRTADPTGVWDAYFLTYAWFPDVPAPGASTDKLAFTLDLYDFAPGANCTTGMPYLQTNVAVSDWADALSGGGTDGIINTREYSFTDDEANPNNDAGYLPYIGARVAVQVPATSPVMHLVARHDAGGTVGLFYTAISGSAVTDEIEFGYDADLNTASIIGPLVDPPDPIQSDASTVTTELTSRPTDAIWQNGRLTTVTTGGCTPTGDSTQRDCVRVTQLNTPASAASAPTRRQDFLIAKNGAHSYLGGIGQSGNGTLHVVWTESADGATDQDPSAWTAYQLPTAAVNTLGTPASVAAGTGGPYTGGRWGGHQGVAQDPQVPNAVWQGGLFSQGGATWATRVSQLQTGGATYVPIDPTRVVDSRTNVGVTGIFNAGTPKTFQVAGVATIPANAIAVTGNVTVTGQSAAGYVSITTTATATPRSSTLNFPTGENRANNVTASLASNGTLAAVYKAAAGKKAHVIFDVTGYFLPGPEDAAYNTVTPVRLLDTRVGNGLSGKFVSGTPRELLIGTRGGIPAGAVAITANLTVVGQTKAGFVSVTPTSIVNPTTSNINFPTKDVRANGLTAKLIGGKLWLVYKAATAAQTDLILDVTGYYLAAGSGLAFFPLDPGRIMDTRTTVLSGLTGQFTASAPTDTRHRRALGRAGRGGRRDRQPDGHRPDGDGLRLDHPDTDRQPDDLDDQLPVGRHARQRRDRAAQRQRQHEPRLQGRQRQEDAPDPGRDRLLRLAGSAPPRGQAGRSDRALPQLVADLGQERFLGGRAGRRRLADEELADPIDDERHDQEHDQCVDQQPPADGDLLARRIRAQHDLQLREVDAAERPADGRHDHVVDERRHDAAQRRADDDADGQGQGVALGQELPKAAHGIGQCSTTLGRSLDWAIQSASSLSLGTRRTMLGRAATTSWTVVARLAALRWASSAGESTPAASSRSEYSDPTPLMRIRST